MMKLVCLISIKLNNGNSINKWVYDRVDMCFPKNRKWFISLVDLERIDIKQRYDIADKLVDEDLGYWAGSEEEYLNLLRADKNSEVLLLKELGLIKQHDYSLSVKFF